MDTLTIALTGLNAQKQSLAKSASNIAHATTTGRVPTADNPVSTVYRPLDVSFTALTVGQGVPAGVQATISEDTDGYSVTFSPNHPDANAEGLIAMPNVDYAEEAVNMITTKNAYKAILSVIKVQDELNSELLDTLA